MKALKFYNEKTIPIQNTCLKELKNYFSHAIRFQLILGFEKNSYYNDNKISYF